MAAVARIVRDRGSVRYALPPHVTQEIVEHPQAVAVPGANRHALGLMAWQGTRLPLIDVAVRLGACAPRSGAPRYALVVAVQPAPGAPIEHAAIALDALPETVAVDDAAACEIPASDAWHSVAISCFLHDGVPVPIVDTAKVVITA
ncbi:chemotaxis protein CheW [Ramlibacter sp. PS4R-6]|uniref:chemotaxis protein CheW n=1 Tax=Ramlibacter sp. PS4R-6 TaxID=3133438 RepID=UPI0030B4AFA1